MTWMDGFPVPKGTPPKFQVHGQDKVFGTQTLIVASHRPGSTALCPVLGPFRRHVRGERSEVLRFTIVPMGVGDRGEHH